MCRQNWIYASESLRPDQNEVVLCDLGKDYEFCIMKYTDGIFLDESIGEYYNLGSDVKRWAHIGKHYDEQF